LQKKYIRYYLSRVIIRMQFFAGRPVLLIWLSFFCRLGFSQTVPYLHFSIAEGLPSSEVYNVHQDRTGFIWFATDNGVLRYDGKSMDLYQTKEGLADPVVFEFVEDAKGRVWFRSMSGKISYFEGEKVHPYPFSDTLSKLVSASFLQSLYIDSTDRVWFGTGPHQGYIDSSGKIQTEDTIKANHLSFRNVESHLIYSRVGPINRIKLCKINGATFNVKFHESSERTQICLLQWRNKEYFSIGSCIYQLNKNSITKVFQGLSHIISLNLDHEDNLWIGYLLNTVECYSSFEHKKNLNIPFMRSKSVTKVLQDIQGGYWMSTLQDGVYYVPELSFFAQYLSTSSKIKTVLSKNDRTFIIDERCRIFLLRNASTRFLKKLDNLALTAFFDMTDNLWVSTDKAIYKFDSSNSEKKIRGEGFTGLRPDSQGFIWGTSGRQLWKFDPEGKIVFVTNLNKSSPLLTVTTKYIYRFGRIGLEVFDYKKDVVAVPKLFQGLRISTIVSLGESTVLVGTIGSGFFVLNEQNWEYKQYSSEGKFNASHLYSACIAGSNLWLGTEKGIAITQIESLLTGTPKFEFITKRNGIINDRVNQLVHAGNRILAISENGFTSIPETYHSQGLPHFYLQNVLVNNQNRDESTIKNLSYFENNIEINFKFIDFKNQNIFARSRLSPKDSWNYSEDRKENFYALGSGKYFYELEYSLDNFHWIKAVSFGFSVSPPWWKSWYLQASIFVSLMLLFFLYFKRRESLLRERQEYLKIINEQQTKLINAELETLERERSRIAKDLHDSIGTNLTAVKMTVRSLLKKYMEPKADYVETELQNTIQEVKDIIYELVPSGLTRYGLTEVIQNHVQKITENLGLEIEVHSFGSEIIKDPKVNLVAFRIIQELLSNSLKHSQSKKVTIHLNFFDDLLNILYQDDGIGFRAESISNGSGLLNIQSRIQTVQGNLKFESGDFGVSYNIDIPLKRADL